MLCYPVYGIVRERRKFWRVDEIGAVPQSSSEDLQSGELSSYVLVSLVPLLSLSYGSYVLSGLVYCGIIKRE